MTDKNPHSDDWYRPEDHPSDGEKSEIWAAVSARLPGGISVQGGAGQPVGDHRPGGPAPGNGENDTPAGSPLTLHWKSFWMGQAAAVLLLLAIFGAVTLWQELSAPDAPQSELEQTYRTSLEELASTSQVLVQPNSEQQREALESQLRGLEEIDRMIEEMRNDMLLNGSTSAKRQQLRRLYATKLDFVQKLILTEEVPS